MVLKYPYFRDISEPEIYETATVHTVVGPIDSQDPEQQNLTPIAVSYYVYIITLFGIKLLMLYNGIG